MAEQSSPDTSHSGTQRSGLSRRDFLKAGVGVAGLAALGPLLTACDSGAEEDLADVADPAAFGVGQSGAGGQVGGAWGQSYESYDAAISAAVDAAQSELAGKSFATMRVAGFRGGFSDGRLQYQTAVRIGYA